MASSQSRFKASAASFDDGIKALSTLVSDLKFKEGDARTDAIRHCNRQIKECDSILRGMGSDLSSMGPKERRAFNAELSQRKADLESQRSALKRDIDRMQRADLMGAAAPQMSAAEKGQRSKLLQAEASSSAASAHLNYARATMHETEETGHATLGTLEEQGQQLRGIKRKTDNVSSFADRGREILNDMENRAMRNQVLLWLAVLVLAASVGAVVYFGYIDSPKNSK